MSVAQKDKGKRTAAATEKRSCKASAKRARIKGIMDLHSNAGLEVGADAMATMRAATSLSDRQIRNHIAAVRKEQAAGDDSALQETAGTNGNFV